MGIIQIVGNIWIQRGSLGGEFNVSLVESWGCDSIQDLIEASDKHAEMSHGKQGESENSYFEIVAPLHWKHSPTFQLDKFVTMVYRNIATCSAKSTC